MVGAGTAIAAGGAAYSANKQADAAEEAASAMGPENLRYATPQLLGDPAQLNPIDILSQLYEANIGNEQQGRDQARKINKFNFKEIQKYYEKVQPYFSQLQSQVGSNAASFARGELPADVQSQITRMSAQQGIQGGFGFGSQGASAGAMGNINLRNLGLNSLELSKFGTNLGMQVNQNARSLLPNMVGLQDFFLNPSQVIGIGQFNAGAQNQFALQNNRTQNEFELLNAGAYNQANQNQIQQQYAGNLMNAQAVGNATQAIGGAISGFGGGLGTGGTNTSTGWGGNYAPTGTGYASYNGMTIPKAQLA